MDPCIAPPVREAVAGEDADTFVAQTAPSIWAQMTLRSHTVTAYDMALCTFYHELMGAHNLSSTAISAIALVYGAVLRRYVAPQLNHSQWLWVKLLPKAVLSTLDSAEDPMRAVIKHLSGVPRPRGGHLHAERRPRPRRQVLPGALVNREGGLMALHVHSIWLHGCSSRDVQSHEPE